MSAIKVENITKRFADLVAVDDFSLEVDEGELVCLLGPSGCGKSTTMRTIGGLEQPDEGRVYINGNDVTRQPAYERDSSTVFQEWALFPHKSVLKNVAFGLKMEGVDKAKRHRKAREMLEMVRLEQFEDSRPKDLSGGQQQRVALARSLIIEPQILMLDEPLSNLDKRLKEEMQIELKNIHEQFNQTILHVTHDQNEAFTLADRIGIMNEGRLVQVGKPREVYNNPKNRFVEEFLGDTNFIDGTITKTTPTSIIANTDLGCLMEVPTDDSTKATGESISLSLRPENLSMKQTKEVSADGGKLATSITGNITNIIYQGSINRIYLDTGHREIFIEKQYDSDDTIQEGQNVTVSWDPDRVIAFDQKGTQITTSVEQS